MKRTREAILLTNFPSAIVSQLNNACHVQDISAPLSRCDLMGEEKTGENAAGEDNAGRILLVRIRQMKIRCGRVRLEGTGWEHAGEERSGGWGGSVSYFASPSSELSLNASVDSLSFV